MKEEGEFGCLSPVVNKKIPLAGLHIFLLPKQRISFIIKTTSFIAVIAYMISLDFPCNVKKNQILNSQFEDEGVTKMTTYQVPPVQLFKRKNVFD